jgi:hypothetical protein
MFYLLGRASGRQLPDEYIAAAGELSIDLFPIKGIRIRRGLAPNSNKR